jgi:HPr kinase/phosphorylase
MIRIHGTAIVVEGEGVLLRGPPGAGKSDLALRLIDQGARLVADDQVELRLIAGAVRMTAPKILAGRMEVSGVGILSVPAIASAPLRLVVDLVAPEQIERLPETATCGYFEREFPLLALAPFAVSAAAKLRLAVRSLSMSSLRAHER